jgi:hypothetical protein
MPRYEITGTITYTFTIDVDSLIDAPEADWAMGKVLNAADGLLRPDKYVYLSDDLIAKKVED